MYNCKLQGTQTSFVWEILLEISDLRENKKVVKLKGNLHCLAEMQTNFHDFSSFRKIILDFPVQNVLGHPVIDNSAK